MTYKTVMIFVGGKHGRKRNSQNQEKLPGDGNRRASKLQGKRTSFYQIMGQSWDDGEC